MPLRAKIMPGVLQTRREYASSTSIEGITKPVEGDDPEDVMFSSIYGLRTIELNRPKKLNSLNGSMARKIMATLNEWEKSELANVVVIQGAGRAFCAGGDVAALANWNREGPEGSQRSADYFALEYKLDHFIAAYSKPYIAYMDGITMGGGVGLSIHAPFRIATENTVFAMPETTIGFFPDVGASFFLPKMDGSLGTYLALTSEQLKGVDVFYHGLATHYIHSTSLPALSHRLSELQPKDYAGSREVHSLIASTIAEFDTGLPSPRPQITGGQRQMIDGIFAADSPLDILAGLQDLINSGDHSQEIQQWAEKTIKTIKERSPTSVAVTLRQMREAREWDIAETFQRELDIATHFMHHPDFVEGVTARLINRTKERPNWSPNTLEEVTDEQVNAFFQRVGKEPLDLLETRNNGRYAEYPHAWLGLPTESQIRKLSSEGMSTEEIVKHFIKEKEGKVGVREKVEEVMERH
ncbi:3-hydroxyisobutyryl-CoA hydrolase mitochondrial precursor [Venturia nashicola]|uniref:3-hydroxyisobutyryl-CoA hydrolase n=1 Tax=Venturia nashicola TaxID=86259 RepID=A0A4Z1NSI5_9PEZI|nr:3-hydroxyisobutyryl-CoA hydrolase mitochondrial precursor [Venturia nashicola]TLD29716.1 3-hydroxyisobutyryl-CoA hydrolase mitochondrial precursor [Venturia nashicola]